MTARRTKPSSTASSGGDAPATSVAIACFVEFRAAAEPPPSASSKSAAARRRILDEARRLAEQLKAGEWPPATARTVRWKLNRVDRQEGGLLLDGLAAVREGR